MDEIVWDQELAHKWANNPTSLDGGQVNQDMQVGKLAQSPS